MAGWSKWLDIGENANYKGCGVYKIRMVNLKGAIIEIPRFLSKDQDGILQIGHSINIERRLKYFRGATGGKKHAHAEGQRFNLIKKYTGFMRKYEDFKTQYTFKSQQNKNEAEIEEERLLKCYFKKFGEVPPLNNNLPDKYIKWDSLSCD